MRHATLSILLATVAACAPHQAIEITHAVVRPPIAGRDVAVAYFEIANHSDAAIELVNATSSAARTIEIHTHVHDGDMLRMRKLSSVAVDPGAQVSFAPGGHHLMLFGYRADDADRITITMQFGNGSARSVEFAIESRAR